MASAPLPFSLDRRVAAMLIAAAVGIGIAAGVQFSSAIGLMALIIAAAVAFLCSPLFLFGLYYGVSQFTAGVHVPYLPISLNQALFLATFLSLSRWLLMGQLIRPRGWALWSMLALTLFLTISALTGYSHELGRIAAKTVITLALMSLAISSTLNSPARIRQFCWAILLPTLANGAVAMAESIVNHGIFDRRPDFFHGFFRVNGVAPNSIVFAHICLFALPFALYLCRHSTHRWQRAMALLSAFFLLALTLRTFNRQSLLLMPILILGAAWLFRGALGKWMLIGVAAGAVIAGPVIIPTVIARLQTFSQLGTDASFRIRRDNMINALQLLKEDPLFGAGLGSFPDAWWHVRSFRTFYNQYEVTPRVQEVDMSFIRLAGETGWTGLLLNIAYYLAMTMYVWRMRRRIIHQSSAANSALIDYLSILLLAWLFFILTSAMQDTILYVRSWLMFGMTAGLSALCRSWFMAEEGEALPARMQIE